MQTIRPITNEDISIIISLHKEALPDTTSSKIGLEYLAFLYQGLLSRPEHLLYCVVEKGSILGVITATPDLSKTSSFLTRYLYPKALPILLHALIFGRVSVRDVLEQIQFERALLAHFPTPYPTILTLFVTPHQQGKGVGRSLVEAVKKEFHKKRINTFYVDTLASNTSAQKFYTAIGGKEKARIQNAVIYYYTNTP